MGGKTSAKSKNTWISKAYDRINLTVAKGKKEIIQTAAAATGESVNAYINGAIDARIARDARKIPQEAAGAPPGGGVVSLPSEEAKTAQRATESEGGKANE